MRILRYDFELSCLDWCLFSVRVYCVLLGLSVMCHGFVVLCVHFVMVCCAVLLFEFT